MLLLAFRARLLKAMDKVIHWTNMIYPGQLLSTGLMWLFKSYPLDKYELSWTTLSSLIWYG